MYNGSKYTLKFLANKVWLLETFNHILLCILDHIGNSQVYHYKGSHSTSSPPNVLARTWFGQFRELVLKCAVRNVELAVPNRVERSTTEDYDRLVSCLSWRTA